MKGTKTQYLYFFNLTNLEVITMDYSRLYETIERILPSLELVDEYENPQAIAHFTNQQGWNWFVLAGQPLGNDDFYLFGLVNGYEKELGFFTLKQILQVGAVYDIDFKPIGVFDIYPDFDLRR